jgi:histidyl-tRNA synthetase
MKKQMTYANAKGMRFVVMTGEDEMQQQKVTVKNMETGEQKTVSTEEMLQIIKP